MQQVQEMKQCLATLLAAISLFTVIADPVRADCDQLHFADLAEQKQWQQLASQLQAITKDDAAVNAVQPDGMTALHWAVLHGEAEIVDRLIAAGANTNAETRYKITPLYIACTLNNSEIVEKLLKHKADPNTVYPGGVTALMLAARTGNAASIKHLIQHDAEADATERQGQTAMMWATAEGNAAAVHALISAGADPNREDKAGFTAMLFAARHGRTEVADTLLKAGVDVNFAMESKRGGNRAPSTGTSAMLMAVESGHFELAMFLVNHGADPNDQRSGFTALHVLTWVRKPKVGEDPDGDPPPQGSGSLTSLEFAKLIAAAGADVNTQLVAGKGGKAFLNMKGATPVLLASRTADLPYMKLLIELGADPTITNVDGCHALMAAAGVGVRAVGEEPGSETEVIEAIEFLIGHGLDVNTVDRNKETAMHGAAYRNFPLVVNYLAAHGSDSALWNHKNASGWTPVMIAEGHRPGSFKPSPETVKALEAAMNLAIKEPSQN